MFQKSKYMRQIKRKMYSNQQKISVCLQFICQLTERLFTVIISLFPRFEINAATKMKHLFNHRSTQVK